MKETTRKVEQNLLKKEQGITLVALVVTIIALLIISAVAISFGVEGGVVDQAITAEEETIIGEEKEKILLAYQGAELDYQIEKNGLTLKDFETNLAPYIEEGTVELEAVSKSDIPEGANILVERNNPTAEYAKVTYIETGHIYYVELIPEYVDPDAETYEIKYISEKSDGTEETVTHVKQEGAPYEVQHISNVDGLTSSKQGYTFGGWSTSKGGTSQYAPGSVYNDNSSLTLYAVWIADYTITYDANGGENAPEEGKKPHEMSYNISSEKPTRTGYSFAGWSTTRNGSIEYTGGETYETNADLTLYAVWNQDAVITYNPNGGTGNEVTENKKYGETYTIAENTFIRENYIFEGWSTTDTGTVEYTVGQEYTENSSLTLYAVWKEELKVTYNPNGGDGEVVVENKNYDETYTIAGNTFTRENYIFDGWSTTDTGTVEYTVGQEYTENSSLTLYAVWKEELKVTYNPNGGDGEVVVENKNYGETYTISSTIPTRAGFDFTGWSTSATGAVEYTAGQEYTEDSSLTLYAVWGTQEYVITYDANGGENAPASVIKESDVTYIITSDEPTYSGFAFLGWSETSDGSVTYVAGDEYTENSSLTLYAVWSEQYYLVDGTTYAPTLEQALAIANQTGSTIEVLRNVTDKSQVINVGKEVTLNLGEFRITLDKTITIAEAGNLTILGVQGNGQNAAIENNTGVAIENNGILNIGQDDGNLSSYAPRISGTTRGLVTTSGTTNFYDGEIEGDTAIEGDVIVPDTLAARSTVDGTRETVRISSLGDAVARVGYNYYSTIQEAVNTVETGTQEDAEREITIEPIIVDGENKFIYEDGALKTEAIDEAIQNDYGVVDIYDKVAKLSIRVDLTQYSSDEINTLKFNFYTTNSEGGVFISKGNDISDNGPTSSNMIFWHFTESVENDYSVELEGGRVIYFNIWYFTVYSPDYMPGGIIIANMRLNDEMVSLTEETTVVDTFKKNLPPNTPTKISILTNISTVAQEQLIIGNRNIILDLDGKQLSVNDPIYNEGKLEILDTSIERTGNIEFTEIGSSTEYTNGILNEGELIISTHIKTGANRNILIRNRDLAILELKSGARLESSGGANLMKNSGSSVVKMIEENINITQTGNTAIYVEGNSSLELNDINISADEVEIMFFSSGNLKISNMGLKEIRCHNAAKVELSGENEIDKITNDSYSTINISGNLNITDDLVNKYNATVNILSGNVKGEINLEGSSILNVFEGNIESSINGVDSSIINILAGKIGRIVIGDSAILKIGEKDGVLDITKPEIGTNQSYGVSSTGDSKIYFYDGIIKGKTAAVLGGIEEIESNYELIQNLDAENNKIVYLGNNEIAQIGEKKFNSLKKAIDSIEENNTEPITIQMINEHINIYEIDISNKKIVLDLNGKKIENIGKIRNRGELQIIDTSVDNIGMLKSIRSGSSNSELFAGIINTGLLEVAANIQTEGYYEIVVKNEENGIVKVLEEAKISYGKYGVYNEGTGKVEIIGGTLEENEYGIYNAGTGEIHMLSGKIRSTSYRNSYGIYNKSTGIVKIEDGELTFETSSSGGCKVIVNEKAGTVEINGGIFNSDGTGVENYQGGTLIMSNGNITSKTGIYNFGIANIRKGTINGATGINNRPGGVVNIGIKNTESDTVVDREIPKISGTTYGIQNENATVNFYDGILEGRTDSVLGSISNIEEGYSIIKDELDGYKRAYLGQLYVAQIGETKYMSIESAIASISEGNTERETIKIIGEIADVKEEDLLIENRNIILDLNGYRVSLIRTIVNSGELKIEDTSIGNTGVIEFHKSGLDNDNLFKGIKNTGILEIAANIEMKSQYTAAINNDSDGTLKIVEEGNILASNDDIYLVYNNIGTVDVMGGNLKSTDRYNKRIYGVYNVNEGSVNFVSGDSVGIYNIGKGTINVVDGTIVKIYNNNSEGTINIEGAIISGISNLGILNVDGGEISGRIDNSGIVDMTAGNITSSGKGIANVGTGIVNIKGGMITSYEETIYNTDEGTINIEGGKIISTNSSYDYYGVYNYRTGIINIGTKNLEGETNINAENPIIQAEGYAIYNELGTVNFYDGILKGKIDTIYGRISNIENGYEIVVDELEGYKRNYLGQQYVAQIGSENYFTIESAINSIPEENVDPQTIKIINEIIDLAQEDLVLGNRKIILDLNGYNVNLTRTIVNSAELYIIDTSVENKGVIRINKAGSLVETFSAINNTGLLEVSAKIETRARYTTAIKNEENGILELLEGSNLVSSYDQSYMIVNNDNATVELKGGQISVSSDEYEYIYGIDNKAEGNVIISSGTINLESDNYLYGIINEQGTVTMTGGTISTRCDTGYNSGNTYTEGIINRSGGVLEITGGTINTISTSTSVAVNNLR